MFGFNIESLIEGEDIVQSIAEPKRLVTFGFCSVFSEVFNGNTDKLENAEKGKQNSKGS